MDAFNAPDGPPVFLISLKAGGTGLNLVAADHVFHLDPWWNPAVEDQAVARCHRIGQTAQWVDVFRFHSKATGEEEGSKGFRTLDEYSAEKQAEKRILMDELVENERSVA